MAVFLVSHCPFPHFLLQADIATLNTLGIYEPLDLELSLGRACARLCAHCPVFAVVHPLTFGHQRVMMHQSCVLLNSRAHPVLFSALSQAV